MTTNDLLVTEFGANKVSRIDLTTGTVSVFASVLEPDEMAVNSLGHVFVKTHRPGGPISRFDSSGNFLGSFTPFLGFPTGIVFDSADNLYVADSTTSTIWKFAAGGTFTSPTVFARGLPSLEGIAFTPSGQLFAIDFTNGRVHQVTPGGTTLDAHIPWATNLKRPLNFAFDPISGNIFVSNSDTIMRISAPGIVTTLASGFTPGIGLGAYDLDFDCGGNLYVDDFSRGEIWKLSPSLGLDPKILTITLLPLNDGRKLSLEDSPLAGLAGVFVKEGCKNQVDPRFMIAIAAQESLLGTAYLNQQGQFSVSDDGTFFDNGIPPQEWQWKRETKFCEKFNPFGLLFSSNRNILDCVMGNFLFVGRPALKFDSWTKAIEYLSDLLATNYLYSRVGSVTTVDKIAPIYSSLAEALGWSAGVKRVMQQLGGNPEDVRYPKGFTRPPTKRRFKSWLFSDPADVLIIDPQGFRVGVDPTTGQVVKEIPSTSFSGRGTEPTTIEITDPIEGFYRILLIGTADTPYFLRVTGDDFNGTFNSVIREGELKANQTSEVLVRYSKDSGLSSPPVANAGPDQTVECTSSSGASVSLNGSESFDPDGDLLTFIWTGPFGAVSGVTPTVPLPLGVHTVTLTVSDGQTIATDTLLITVRDTTPPPVDIKFDQTVPPTVHGPQDEEFFVSVNVQDRCDSAPQFTSINLVGTDEFGVEHRFVVAHGSKVRIRVDNQFSADVAIGGTLVNNEFTVRLRAFTVRLEAAATDVSGNIGTGTAIPIFSQ